MFTAKQYNEECNIILLSDRETNAKDLMIEALEHMYRMYNSGQEPPALQSGNEQHEIIKLKSNVLSICETINQQWNGGIRDERIMIMVEQIQRHCGKY